MTHVSLTLIVRSCFPLVINIFKGGMSILLPCCSTTARMAFLKTENNVVIVVIRGNLCGIFDIEKTKRSLVNVSLGEGMEAAVTTRFSSNY